MLKSKVANRHSRIFQLEAKRIIRFLSIVASVLTIIHFLIWVNFDFHPEDTPFIVQLFDLDYERNIPTLFSVILLLLNAVLLIGVAFVLGKKEKNSVRNIWLLTSACFLFLSLDEFACIHEKIIDRLRLFLDLDGFLYFAWVIPYGILLLLFVVSFVPTLWRTSGVARFPYLIAALVYVLGGIGFEMLGAKYYSINEFPDSTFKLLTTVEEGLEMAGLILFIRASFKLLFDEYQRLELHIMEKKKTTEEVAQIPKSSINISKRFSRKTVLKLCALLIASAILFKFKAPIAVLMLQGTEKLDDWGLIHLGLTEEEAVAYVDDLEPYVIKPAQTYGMDVEVLKAVIYGEVIRNYNWLDDIEDVVMYIDITDKIQGHRSYGVFQMQGEAIQWILENLHDPESPFYLGKEIAMKFPPKTNREIKDALKEPAVLAEYFVIYNLMKATWWDSNSDYTAWKDPGLLATMYSRPLKGLKPHNSPGYNQVGHEAMNYYLALSRNSQCAAITQNPKHEVADQYTP